MPSKVTPPSSRTSPVSSINWLDIIVNVAIPIAGMLIALAFGAILLLFLQVNPFQAYSVMLGGAFGSWQGFVQALVKATPLLLVGLGICIAFRASVINIGGEGQIIAGALMAT